LHDWCTIYPWACTRSGRLNGLMLMAQSKRVRALRLTIVGVLALVGPGLQCDDEIPHFYSVPPAPNVSQLRQRITWAVQRGLSRSSEEVNASVLPILAIAGALTLGVIASFLPKPVIEA
jgi:hypothetical protein